ncbi:MAG: hypothetical protein WCL06_13170 [Bacteroidota bacterium]
MDKRTDARIEALVQSGECQINYKTLWDTMSPFVKANAKIADSRVQIIQKCIEAGFKSKGVTTDKAIKMEDMIDGTLVIAASLYDFADDNNNNELMVNSHVTRWTLKDMSDLEKANACDAIVALANANIADMGTDYIIKQLDIDNLAATVTAFRVHIPKPRQVISSGATARAEIRLLVKDAYKVLKKLDKLMEHFKKSNFEFYHKWFRARNIILKGEHKKPETDENVPIPPEDDEYVKEIGFGKIEKIDFTIKPELTYLITHLAGNKLKYWTSASDVIPDSVPADAKILDIGAEIEVKGVDLIGGDKIYLFFANEDGSVNAQVAVDILEE